jgi:hypothetical protein
MKNILDSGRQRTLDRMQHGADRGNKIMKSAKDANLKKSFAKLALKRGVGEDVKRNEKGQAVDDNGKVIGGRYFKGNDLRKQLRNGAAFGISMAGSAVGIGLKKGTARGRAFIARKATDKLNAIRNIPTLARMAYQQNRSNGLGIIRSFRGATSIGGFASSMKESTKNARQYSYQQRKTFGNPNSAFSSLRSEGVEKNIDRALEQGYQPREGTLAFDALNKRREELGEKPDVEGSTREHEENELPTEKDDSKKDSPSEKDSPTEKDDSEKPFEDPMKDTSSPEDMITPTTENIKFDK